MSIQVKMTLRADPGFPAEADMLNPRNVTGKSVAEIAALPVLVGNATCPAGDLFDIEINAGGDAAANDGLADLLLTGDLIRVKRIGDHMDAGRLHVDGRVGFHAGSYMSGGELTISGDAGDFLGAHLAGGRIEVLGSAGNFTGAAYRGYNRGMTGGTILVRGNVGQMFGARMRRGLVVALGDCGDVPGFGMRAGTILIGGASGVRAGADMARGSIIFLKRPAALLPTFLYNCAYRPPFWPLLLAHLAGQGLPLPAGLGPRAVFERYSGDSNEGAKGEILICHAWN